MREPESSCVLHFRARGVAPGRPEGSISNARLRGISALIVLAPYTFDMLSLVLAFEFVENATVFFLVYVSRVICCSQCHRLPLWHQVAHAKLDANTDACVRIEQL